MKQFDNILAMPDSHLKFLKLFGLAMRTAPGTKLHDDIWREQLRLFTLGYNQSETRKDIMLTKAEKFVLMEILGISGAYYKNHYVKEPWKTKLIAKNAIYKLMSRGIIYKNNENMLQIKQEYILEIRRIILPKRFDMEFYSIRTAVKNCWNLWYSIKNYDCIYGTYTTIPRR